MEIKAETKWLCENAKDLERFSGKWVGFNADQGLVGESLSLLKILKAATKLNASRVPFVFHVPSKHELNHPLPMIKKNRASAG